MIMKPRKLPSQETRRKIFTTKGGGRKGKNWAKDVRETKKERREGANRNQNTKPMEETQKKTGLGSGNTGQAVWDDEFEKNKG